MAKELLWGPIKERWDQLGWKYDKDEARMVIKRQSTGCTIALKSAEKERSLRGKGLNGVFFDEFSDIKKVIWTHAIRPALSDKLGFAEFLGTPKGMNHFYDLFCDAKVRADWATFQFTTLQSPFFQTSAGQAEIVTAMQDLDSKTFRQEYEASFENFGGLIMYAFDRGKFNTDYSYNPELPIYIGQDFNRNPMSGVLFQKVAGKLIAFEEMSVPTSSTDEVCRMILEKFPKAVQRGVIFRPDASGSRRTSNSSRSDHEIIRSYGLKIDVGASNPRRIDRWASGNKAFENGTVLINTKKCPKLTREFETIAYKEGTCEPDIRDALVGHLFDAFGYNVYYDYPLIKQISARVQNY